ncbi:hypothetical protein TNCV_2251891 [Trichonephila clavipes]|nr:hypothetical protein TNCV_2251891 [Trichonephila clavipes]
MIADELSISQAPVFEIVTGTLALRLGPARLFSVPKNKIDAQGKSSWIGRGDSTGRDDDEAHFWLNGYVNKENCYIWSEANPQVYVETPLHPEKLTVWCALWAGGILLQKR